MRSRVSITRSRGLTALASGSATAPAPSARGLVRRVLVAADLAVDTVRLAPPRATVAVPLAAVRAVLAVPAAAPPAALAVERAPPWLAERAVFWAPACAARVVLVAPDFAWMAVLPAALRALVAVALAPLLAAAAVLFDVVVERSAAGLAAGGDLRAGGDLELSDDVVFGAGMWCLLIGVTLTRAYPNGCSSVRLGHPVRNSERCSWRRDLLGDEQLQQCLLRVTPVLGLIPDALTVAV